ncbi:MAG: NPCBM/NEW2 domain-containing protein, partial [Planctomycetaceae bacterium]|nr:NPCBM/NEW2 domain-containing protein [Planctomycetaceae bacterium]
CEGKKTSPSAVGRLMVSGQQVRTEELLSEAGWSATGLPHPEFWTFLRAPLAHGDNRLSLEEFVGDDCTRVSVWVLASKPGSGSDYPNALPQPESISLEGAALLLPTDAASLPAEAVPADRPTEHIDGVFLDTLEPVSVTQGWGTLQKNRGVWEKPMVIGGKLYPRGLGTHAPSKIVYSLGGKYRRFQSFTGGDANASPTVTFEVRVDGVSRWQSGMMTRGDRAAWVDVDVTGAKTLELLVHDAGDRSSDHADWAEARLLR